MSFICIRPYHLLACDGMQQIIYKNLPADQNKSFIFFAFTFTVSVSVVICAQVTEA